MALLQPSRRSRRGRRRRTRFEARAAPRTAARDVADLRKPVADHGPHASHGRPTHGPRGPLASGAWHARLVTTAERELWRCPKCGAKLITRNLSHACGEHSIEAFLKGKSERSRALFER